MKLDDNTTIRNCIFAVKCSMKWDDLCDTENHEIRFCHNCQKEVFFCDTDEKIVDAIKKNKCVSIISPYSMELLLGLPMSLED